MLWSLRRIENPGVSCLHDQRADVRAAAHRRAKPRIGHEDVGVLAAADEDLAAVQAVAAPSSTD